MGLPSHGLGVLDLQEKPLMSPRRALLPRLQQEAFLLHWDQQVRQKPRMPVCRDAAAVNGRL